MRTFKFPELPNITEYDLDDGKIYGVLVSDEIQKEFRVMHQVAKLKSIRYGVDFIKYNPTLEGLTNATTAVYPHATSGQGTNPESEDACTLHVVNVDYDPDADNEHNVYFRSILYTRTTDMPQSAAARLAHAKYKELCTTPCVSGTPLTVSQFLPNVDEFVTNTNKLYDSCKLSMATLKEETTWSLVELLEQYQAIVDDSVLATPAIMDSAKDKVELDTIQANLNDAVAELNAELQKAAGDMVTADDQRKEIAALEADIAEKDGEIAGLKTVPVAMVSDDKDEAKDAKIVELQKELAEKKAEIDRLTDNSEIQFKANTSLTNENQMLQHQGNAAITALNAELHELRTHYAWPDERINNLQTLLELPEDTLPTFELIVKTTYANFPTDATVQLEMVNGILTRALSKKLIIGQQAANFANAAKKAPTPPALISCLTELYDAIVATKLVNPAVKAEPGLSTQPKPEPVKDVKLEQGVKNPRPFQLAFTYRDSTIRYPTQASKIELDKSTSFRDLKTTLKTKNIWKWDVPYAEDLVFTVQAGAKTLSDDLTINNLQGLEGTLTDPIIVETQWQASKREAVTKNGNAVTNIASDEAAAIEICMQDSDDHTAFVTVTPNDKTTYKHLLDAYCTIFKDQDPSLLTLHSQKEDTAEAAIAVGDVINVDDHTTLYVSKNGGASMDEDPATMEEEIAANDDILDVELTLND